MRKRIKRLIADYWQGISNQPAWRRYEGQVDDALNGRPDPVDGFRTRNGTTLQGSWTLPTGLNLFDCRFARLAELRIIISKTSIYALKPDMTEVPVEDLTATDFAYLDCDCPALDIDWVVALDSMIVANRTVTVEGETTPDYQTRGEVTYYSELQDLNPSEGDTYRVIISENLDPAGYYRFSAGEWERIAPPASVNGRIKRSTAPHRLVYLRDEDRCVWQTFPYEDRRSGNETTNRAPKFIGSQVRAVAYSNNRLFFISSQAVEASHASDIFRWYVNDLTNVVDADRISVDILISRAGTPLFAEALGNDLVIACDESVLAFSSGDQQLTNINGRVRLVERRAIRDIRPTSNGALLVMVDRDGQVRGYAYQGLVSGIQPAGSLSHHVQRLVLADEILALYLIGDVLYIVNHDGSVLTHDMLVSDGQLAQSAWSRFALGNGLVWYVDEDADDISVYSSVSGKLIGASYDQEVDPTDAPRLDESETVEGEYDAKRDETRLVHTASSATAASLATVNGQPIPVLRTQGRAFFVRGKVDEALIGFSYSSSLELSKLYDGGANLRTKLRRIGLFYDRSGPIALTVRENERSYRSIYNAQRTGDILGDADLLRTGAESRAARGDARSVSLTFSNQPGLPMTVSAVEMDLDIRGRI